MWVFVLASSSNLLLISSLGSANLNEHVLVWMSVSISETPLILARSTRTESAHPPHVIFGTLSLTCLVAESTVVAAMSGADSAAVGMIVSVLLWHPAIAVAATAIQSRRRFILLLQKKKTANRVRPGKGLGLDMGGAKESTSRNDCSPVRAVVIERDKVRHG